MPLSKIKADKLERIFDAAEVVFKKYGFHNAKMSDIAKEAGIVKVTLYSYIETKENLYMGLIYRFFQTMNDQFYTIEHEHKNEDGIETVMALAMGFVHFCNVDAFRTELFLDYFSIVRNAATQNENFRLTDGMKTSMYFSKTVNIHNIPLKLTAKHITRGIQDKSIHESIDPVSSTFMFWSFITGYIKFSSILENNPIVMNTDLRHTKHYINAMTRQILENGIVGSQTVK